MRLTKTTLTAGFAMFSMFFGSGNLVFPLVIGTETLNMCSMAMLGLLITGVVMPFLGLYGVILYAGNRLNFFACTGKIPAFLLTFAMLSLMGPFGVSPRCTIVAHGGVQLLFPDLPLWLFSLIFSIITGLLVWKHHRVIPIIGRILTPVLLGGILILVVSGILLGPQIPNSNIEKSEAFINGLTWGFQTMDLLAAFFFAATTVAYIRSHLRSDDGPKVLSRLSLRASIVGASLLGGVYLSFVYLGAQYSEALAEIAPQQMLVAIAGKTLGSLAMPVAGITITMACLTTATILTLLFSDFLKEDICKDKLNSHISVVITLSITFIVSLVGFNTLKIWIYTALKVAYPALIVLTIGNIVHKLWGPNFSKWGFWLTLSGCVVLHLI